MESIDSKVARKFLELIRNGAEDTNIAVSYDSDGEIQDWFLLDDGDKVKYCLYRICLASYDKNDGLLVIRVPPSINGEPLLTSVHRLNAILDGLDFRRRIVRDGHGFYFGEIARSKKVDTDGEYAAADGESCISLGVYPDRVRTDGRYALNKHGYFSFWED